MEARIGKKLVDGLNPASLTSRLVVSDTEVRGFQLRVYPPSKTSSRGQKSYYIYYRDKSGTQHRRKIGDHGQITAEQARATAARWLGFLVVGQQPPEWETPEPEAKSITIGELIDLFIEKYQKPKNDTWREVEARLNRYVRPQWGGREAKTITPADVTELIQGIVDKGYRNAGTKTLLHLNRMFVWRLPLGDVPAPPPTAGLEKPMSANRRTRILSDGELKAIWEACDKVGYPGGSFVKLLLLLGQRREEVAGLRWADLDAEATVWSKPAELVKAERPHLVPIPSQAREVIQGLPRNGAYLFSTDGVTHVKGYSKIKKAIDESSEVKDWWLHDCRRTVATNMGRAGVSRFIIERVLNHADRSVTGVYDLWVYFDEKRDALQRWGDLLTRICEREKTEATA